MAYFYEHSVYFNAGGTETLKNQYGNEKLSYCKFLMHPWPADNRLTPFDSSGVLTFKTGSSATEPSFKGILASVAVKCRRWHGSNLHNLSPYRLATLAETKLKGLWYFDENSFPRLNLANPYNSEPRFEMHASAPLWDPAINRWKVFNGRRITLPIRNFLDFRDTELLRGLSIVLDLRLLPDPSRISADVDVLIGTLTSDVTLGLFFNGSGPTGVLKWKFRIAEAEAWTTNDYTVDLPESSDIIMIIGVTRNLAQQTQWAYCNKEQGKSINRCLASKDYFFFLNSSSNYPNSTKRVSWPDCFSRELVVHVGRRSR